MPPASAQVSALGFDQLYGLELVELRGDWARGKVVVRDGLKRPDGHVAGGVYAVVAESLASLATAAAVEAERRSVSTLALQMSFLRPIAEGSIDAIALARHRGRTTWVWEIEIADQSGQLCGLARVTIAVRGGSGPA